MVEAGILRPGIAIPTEFRGTNYRSRLEANVAQSLMDMGIEFEYEARSFLVNGKHYSPDFYLPEQGKYVEARGYITETSEAMLEAFAKQVGQLFVFYRDSAQHIQLAPWGEIWRQEIAIIFCDSGHASIATLGNPPKGATSRCWLCNSSDLDNFHESSGVEVAMRSGVPVILSEVGKYTGNYIH